MTKKNKKRKCKVTLEEMVRSGNQMIIMHDDGTEHPIEEILQAGKKVKTITRKPIETSSQNPELNG